MQNCPVCGKHINDASVNSSCNGRTITLSFFQEEIDKYIDNIGNAQDIYRLIRNSLCRYTSLDNGVVFAILKSYTKEGPKFYEFSRDLTNSSCYQVRYSCGCFERRSIYGLYHELLNHHTKDSIVMFAEKNYKNNGSKDIL
jgi:hypothetical protein